MRRTRFPGSIGVIALLIATAAGGVFIRQGVSANEPQLTLTPAHVSCSTTITALGTNFEPGSEVALTLGGIDNIPGTVFETAASPATVAEDGSFSSALELRPLIDECSGGPLGRDGVPYNINASIATGSADLNTRPSSLPVVATASFTFAIDPSDTRLILTPDHGSGCVEVIAHGENFEPGTYVSILIGGLGSDHFAEAIMDHPVVDEDGSFSVALDHRFTPFISCEGESVERDGMQYLVRAWTGRGSKPYGDPSRPPYAADIFTVTLAPNGHDVE